MRVVGLDLAGSPKNGTGYCLLDVGESKSVKTLVLHSDDEIMGMLSADGPQLVAVDAPLSYKGARRLCDEQLREYGAIPVTLKGMETLALRGVALATRMSAENLKCIEVFSTASAKVLGVFSRNDFSMQKAMMALDLQGDVNTRILTRDELDAVAAAVTGYLHLMGKTRTVGDDSGAVVLPSV